MRVCLLRISGFSFAMLPVGIANENKTLIALISIFTIVPLIIHIYIAIRLTQKTKKPFLTNLLDYKYNYIDVAIAALGIVNCILEGLLSLSVIWIVSFCIALADKFSSRR